jgi:Domain of unknown function (DUF4190)
MSYDQAPPPPPPPPGYGAPVPGGQAAEHPRATLIMILGILSIPCCGLFTGIPAIIMGKRAQDEIARSGGGLGGESKVKAGYICGIIGTVLSILGLIVNLAIRAA